MPVLPLTRINARIATNPAYHSMHLGAHSIETWEQYQSHPDAVAYFGPPEVWAALAQPGNAAGVDAFREWYTSVKQYNLLYYNWSATTCRNAPLHEPPDFVPTQHIIDEVGEDGVYPYYWGGTESEQEGTASADTSRRYINLTIPEVRQLVANYIVDRTLEDNYSGIGLDNITWRQGIPPVTQGGVNVDDWWVYQLDLLARIRSRAGSSIKIMVNATIPPLQARTEGLGASVDHYSYELALHPVHVLPYADRIQSEILAVRDWCNNGQRSYTPWTFGLEYSGMERGLAHRMLAGMLMLARQPNDKVFLHRLSTTPRREDWFAWPVTLGNPIGEFTRKGFEFRRRFQRGRLIVDFSRLRVIITR